MSASQALEQAIANFHSKLKRDIAYAANSAELEAVWAADLSIILSYRYPTVVVEPKDFHILEKAQRTLDGYHFKYAGATVHQVVWEQFKEIEEAYNKMFCIKRWFTPKPEFAGYGESVLCKRFDRAVKDSFIGLRYDSLIYALERQHPLTMDSAQSIARQKKSANILDVNATELIACYDRLKEYLETLMHIVWLERILEANTVVQAAIAMTVELMTEEKGE